MQNEDYSIEEIEPIDSRLGKLELEKLNFPEGKESANYYYHSEEGTKTHFNKFYEKSFIELPEGYNAEEYSDPRETDYNSVNTDVNESLEHILELKSDPYKILKYIEPTDIEEILQRQSQILDNLIIISPPSTGKTSQVIRYLIANKQKFIFLVPLKLQVDQLSVDFPDLGKYLPQKGINIHDTVKNYSYIVTTYNSFEKLDPLIHNKWDYYLIIDEFHKLVSDSNYRTQPLAYIYSNMFLYNRFLGLTGTPFGCINNNLLKHNVKLLKVSPAEKFSLIRENYKIIQYEIDYKNSNSSEALFYHYISENIGSGTNMVFANDKKLLEKITNKLFSESIIQEGEFRLISSDTRDEPEIQEIFISSEVATTVKLILATSAMSTGINLKGVNFNNIFIYNEPNLVEIIQFIYRFRDGINNVYDFITFNNQKQSNFNYELEISNLINAYSKITDTINDVFEKDLVILKEFLINKSNSFIKNDLVIYDDYRISLNENRIRWDVLSKLHNRAMLDPAIRIEYLNLYGINTQAPEQDFKDYKYEFKDTKIIEKANRKRFTKFMLEKLEVDASIAVSYFKEEMSSRNHSLFRNTFSQMLCKSLTPEEESTCRINYGDQLGRGILKETISEFLFFLSTGITISTAVKLTQQNKFRKISNAIEFLRLRRFQNFSSLDINTIDKSIHEDILFMQEVINHLKKRETIDFKIFGNELPKFKGSMEFKKYYSASSMEKFRFIFKLIDRPSKKLNKHLYKIEKVNEAIDIFNIAKINSPADAIVLDNYFTRSEHQTWAYLSYR